MENEFAKVMSVKTNEQLIKIVTIDKDDYVPMAILAATEEINRRKIDGAVIKELEENYSQEREKVQAIQSLKVEWGDRILNLIIDDITVFSSIFILNLLVSFITVGQHSDAQQLITFIMIPTVYLGYYVFFEFTYQKTPGKMITKSKVVTAQNEKPDLKSIVIRTLSRIIPCNGIYYLFTFNGLHDKLSGTMVVRDGM